MFDQLRNDGAPAPKGKAKPKAKVNSGQRFSSRDGIVFLPEADLLNAEKLVWQLALARYPYCETAKGIDCVSGMALLGKNWNSIDPKEQYEALTELSKDRDVSPSGPVDWSTISTSQKLVILPTLMTESERKALVKLLPTLEDSPELRGRMTADERFAFYQGYLASDRPPALTYRLPLVCSSLDAQVSYLKRSEYLTEVRAKWREWTDAAGVICRDSSGLPSGAYLGTNWISNSDAKKLAEFFTFKWVVSAEEFEPPSIGLRGGTEKEFIRVTICVKLRQAGIPVPVRVKGDDFTNEELELFARVRQMLPASEVAILYGLSLTAVENHWRRACERLNIEQSTKAGAPNRKRGQARD